MKHRMVKVKVGEVRKRRHPTIFAHNERVAVSPDELDFDHSWSQPTLRMEDHDPFRSSIPQRIAFLFSGRAGAGKDTACDCLSDQLGGIKFPLASGVKELSRVVAHAMYPYLSRQQLHNMFFVSKEDPIPTSPVALNQAPISHSGFQESLLNAFESILPDTRMADRSAWIFEVVRYFFAPSSNGDLLFALADPSGYQPMMFPHHGVNQVEATGRRIAQLVGTLARDVFGDMIWIDTIVSKATSSLSEIIFVPDVRSPNEADELPSRLRAMGFLVVHLGVHSSRLDHRCVDNDTTTHPSEQHIDTLPVLEWIENNGTMGKFRDQVLHVAEHHLNVQLVPDA